MNVWWFNYRLDDRGTVVRFPAGRDTKLSVLHIVQTGYGT